MNKGLQINFKYHVSFKTILNHFSKTTLNLKVPIFTGVVGVLVPSRHVNVLPNPNFVFKDHKPFIGGQSHLNKNDWWRLHCIDFFRVPSRAGNRYDSLATPLGS